MNKKTEKAYEAIEAKLLKEYEANEAKINATTDYETVSKLLKINNALSLSMARIESILYYGVKA